MRRKTAERIKSLVLETMQEMLAPDTVKPLPSGFYPSDVVRGAVAKWLVLPWGASVVVCKLRTLFAGEFPAVGLIELNKQVKENPVYENKARFIDAQLEYCKKALISPTYEELENLVLEELPNVRVGRDAYLSLRTKVEAMDPEEQRQYIKQVQDLALIYGCLFPPNFLSSVASWCECLDATKIKEITPEDLIEAHLMSKINNNRASDNLDGIFLERTRKEIDILAATLYAEKKK